MENSLTRRDALKGILTAGAVAIAKPASALSPEDLQISAQPAEIVITPVSAHTVRVTIQRVTEENAALLTDGALIKEQFGKPVARVRSVAGTHVYKAGDLKVTLSGSPLKIRIETAAGKLVQELALDPDTSDLLFETGDATLLGLGQGGPQLYDRRGGADRMVSGQGGYQLGTHGSRVPIQLLLGTGGWGLYIHRPLGGFDLTGKQGRLHSLDKTAALPIDFFVTSSKEPTVLISEFAKITGFAEMPPLWSFGYQQSYRTLGTPEEIMQEAKTFRDKNLPCDAMIYLGTGFCPEGWNTDNGEFTWNSKAFPDPNKAVQTLHDENFKVVLHVVIEGHKLTGTVHDPCTAAPLPSGRTPDKHWPPDRQVSCYWPVHKPLADMGIDGWWPDQGDGFDPPSRLARNRMYFEGQQMYRPNKRIYALHRNAYVGMQRYAAFLWSGDILSRWETLKNHVPVAINTSISGVPYWGTDTGGFVPTQEYTGELYARWFQFSAFCPLFRSHGRDWRLHRPWGWTKGEVGYIETASYHPTPEMLDNPAIEPICKKYLELRYQLMPYIYTAVKDTCDTGLPIIRAMWIHYPDDATAVARGDQYLFGRDMLVAPVVEKDATSRSVYLPKGAWYDMWTFEKHEGGKEITRTVDLATIPVYIRAGAVIPTGPIKQYTGQKVDAPLTLTVYPGADGTSTLYEDDGETFDYHKGEFTRIEMVWSDKLKHLTLRLAHGSSPKVEKKTFEVRIAGTSTTKNVTFSGQPVSVTL